MAGLADILISKSMQPQNTGYMNAYGMGQQQAYNRGLSGALASGAPRQEVLSKLAYVDPVRAGQEMGVFSSSTNRLTETDKKELQRNKASEYIAEGTQVGNSIISKLQKDPNSDVSAEFARLRELDSLVWMATGSHLPKDVFQLLENEMKLNSNARAQSKEGREQQGNVEKAISTWRKNNIVIENLSKLKNISSFAEQAKLGNAMAIKNLIASTSRLGSNEALSDSELQLMLSGDVGTQFDSLINKYLGTGTIFSAKDVNNAIKVLNNYAVSNLDDIKKLANEKANDLVKTKGSNYTRSQIAKLLLEGTPTSFNGVRANAKFTDMPSNLSTDRAEGLAPNGETKTQPNTALGDLLKIR